MKKTQKRKQDLENRILNGDYPFCTLHKEYIDLTTFYVHHCYSGNHHKKHCKYLRLRE